MLKKRAVFKEMKVTLMRETEALLSQYREDVCERKAVNEELLKNMEQLIPSSEKLVGGLLSQVDHKFEFASVAAA